MTDRIAVVGIGESGLVGMKPAARALIENAKTIVGGARHLRMLPEGHARLIEWTTLEETLDAIEANRTDGLVVLASGDPMWYGLGATLAKRFGPESLFVAPTPGAFSLAAARLGWPLQDTICMTVHGRPLDDVALHLAPGQKLLILGEDEFTPLKIGDLLRRAGYKKSQMTVLSHLGGPKERIVTGLKPGMGLDVIALDCAADDGNVAPLSRAPGLPDDAFLHDGQITKRPVRAATLAALSPLPGQLLWDIGAGSGSVAIEFLRAVPRAKAVAFEKKAERSTRIAQNALALGVPALEIVTGDALAFLDERQDRPDKIFIGGGVSTSGLLESAWGKLPHGGTLVANAVTLEGEAALLAFFQKNGGELSRLGVERLEQIGALHVWKPAAPVLQYCGRKE